MSTNTALDDIKARVAAATLGPWDATEGSDFDGVDTLVGTLTCDDHGGEVFKPADAEFIAHARTDIPKLLAALEAVEAEAAALDALADEVMGDELPTGLRLAARGIRKAIEEALS